MSTERLSRRPLPPRPASGSTEEKDDDTDDQDNERDSVRLTKKSSYVRKDKQSRAIFVPKVLTRKRADVKAEKGRSRRSIAYFLRSIGALLEERVDSESPFNGVWQSESADGEQGFLEELEVSMKYKKLAAKFGGSSFQTLNIVQNGDDFEITSNNDRRTLKISFRIGTPFESENERGESTRCVASWDKNELGKVLVIRSCIDNSCSNPTRSSDRILVVQRQIRDGALHEETSVFVNREERKSSRVYERLLV